MATVQEFDLLQKSAVTQIQADLEAAVEADRLAAQQARVGAELAKTVAETAKAAAETAETNAETAETNAETAATQAAASAAAFQSSYPVTGYKSRVEGDSAFIKNLERLTELYMNQLNLLPYTHFMWDGNSGYKVFDGKLVKAYDMSPNENDGTTTSETEPYAGGLIAPNESLKIKNNVSTSERQLEFTPISRLSTDAWSISIMFKCYNDTNPNAILSQTAASHILYFENNNLIFRNFGETVFYNVLKKNEIVKNNVFTLVANGNGYLSLYKNGVFYEGKTASSTTDFTFNLLMKWGATLGRTFNGEITHIQILTKSLSAHEIQLQHELLRLQHPEIEGIDIGNQHWATSNYEGVVTGNGTVIPEYKYTAANSPELVVNGDFATDTDWTKQTGWSISGGAAHCDGSQTEVSTLYQLYSFQANKQHKIAFEISGYSSGAVRIVVGLGASEWFNTNGVKTFQLNTGSTPNHIYIQADADFIGTIDDVSAKEAGWDELTTPGWCYYNNDPALGAVYGKLYNWYAVAEIAKNPPSGWRVPSYADMIQLRDYLGGSTVAGGKMKALYGGFNNEFTTNESGFSLIGGGFRSGDNGDFGLIDTLATSSMSDSVSTTQCIDVYIFSDNIIFSVGNTIKKEGKSLRLMRNEPAGEDTKVISTGRFATDISGTPKAIAVPFGYKVENIVINSSNALTGVSASLYNYSDALQNELLASTTVDANVPNIFDINSHKMLLQDGYVKVLATGNTGDGMTIDVVLNKIQ